MSENLENKIMSQIKSGKLKLHSRYIFLAEKLGLSSALVLSALLAVLFCSLLLFYLKEKDNLVYLSLGRLGILAFLDSFPYLLVAVFVVLLFAAGYLISQSDWSYKKPFKYVAFGLLAFVLLIGSTLALTGVVRKMEEQAFRGSGPGMFFRPFFEQGIEMRGRGIVGRIFEIDGDYLIVETPHGLQNVSLKNLRCEQFKKDDFIIAIGQRKKDVFMAEKIQKIEPGRMPMIHRGIRRQFEIK